MFVRKEENKETIRQSIKEKMHWLATEFNGLNALLIRNRYTKDKFSEFCAHLHREKLHPYTLVDRIDVLKSKDMLSLQQQFLNLLNELPDLHDRVILHKFSAIEGDLDVLKYHYNKLEKLKAPQEEKAIHQVDTVVALQERIKQLEMENQALHEEVNRLRAHAHNEAPPAYEVVEEENEDPRQRPLAWIPKNWLGH
ncbi:MAG: hypothetical protein SFW66_06355 [Gammaproteobacteria bacterium]|nr:hypothetical protein [Gammaproteobacteria bacterium]